jgi:UDP-3-O-[3-hydroxymyristoyl] N-acetylglucosamine deacetylase
MNMAAITLKKDIEVQGVGLHSGVPCEVVLRPSVGGRVLLRRGVEETDELVLSPENVGIFSRPSPLCTRLENEFGVRIATVEHLLSALHGLGVTSCIVDISAEEVPILDGSAWPWVEAIDRAERMLIDETNMPVLNIEKPVIFESEGRVLTAEPGAKPRGVSGAPSGAGCRFLPDLPGGILAHERVGDLQVGCAVDFPHPAIGRQTWQGVVDEATYRREIAPARTFVLECDVAAAQAAGLAKGGGLHNAVVFGDNGQVLNPEGLRFPDEPVRHKVLDFIGDIYLAGRVVSGAFHLTAPGHTANAGLLRRVVEG